MRYLLPNVVDLYIGNRYVDKVWCDIVPMDAFHMLFGRPTQHDNKVVHDGLGNT